MTVSFRRFDLARSKGVVSVNVFQKHFSLSKTYWFDPFTSYLFRFLKIWARQSVRTSVNATFCFELQDDDPFANPSWSFQTCIEMLSVLLSERNQINYSKPCDVWGWFITETAYNVLKGFKCIFCLTHFLQKPIFHSTSPKVVQKAMCLCRFYKEYA